MTNSYGFADRAAAARLRQAVRGHAHPGRRRGHRRLLLVRRQRRRDRRASASRRPTGPRRARGSPRSAARASASARRTRVRSRPVGARATYNCNTTTLACTRTGWLYGAGGGVSRIFAKPELPVGAHRDRPGSAGRRRARRSADRAARRADADVPRRRATTTSTASAARACRARSSPASWRSPTRRPGIRTASPTRCSTPTPARSTTCCR